MAVGRWTRPTIADLVPIVEKYCIPTVRAVKQYQRDNGEMPRQLDDLSPKYLPSDYFHNQFLRSPVWTMLLGDGIIFNYDHHVHDNIYYNLKPGEEGWQVSGYTNGPIPMPIVTTDP
jgi:hypothetical protein